MQPLPRKAPLRPRMVLGLLSRLSAACKLSEQDELILTLVPLPQFMLRFLRFKQRIPAGKLVTISRRLPLPLRQENSPRSSTP